MKENAFSYVHYPGHLGPRPVTELTSERGILWDAPVKRVPVTFADSLITEGGFQRALDLDDAATLLGRTKKRLRELLDAGRLHGETYHPPREGEPDVPVVVLPARMTAAALKAQLDAEDQKEKTDA